MRKAFYYFMAAAFFVFALFSLGGCGGSNNSLTGGGKPNSPEESKVSTNIAQKLTSSDMVSVMYKDDWDTLIDDYEKTGSADKMNPHTWVFCLTDEEAQELRQEYADDELSLAILESLLFDEERIARDYENENDILLLYPDEEFINRTLQAVGYEGDYVLTSEDAPNGRLEMFAIAKRTIDDRTHIFTYYAACDDAYTLSNDLSAPVTSGDEQAVLSGDKLYFIAEDGSIVDSFDLEAEDEEEVNPNGDDTFEVFTTNRWRNYYEWCASLTDWAKEQSAEASAFEVYSAATGTDLTKIAEAQTATMDFSIYVDGYAPWGNINGGDKVNIKRDNSMAFIIYSCHSFSSGSDYYLVKADARTATKYYQDRVIRFRWEDDTFNRSHGKWWDKLKANMSGHRDPVNYISGFTKSMQIYASIGYIQKIEPIRGIPIRIGRYTPYSMPDVGVLRTAPTNVPKQTEYTNTMGWNIGGTIGTGKDGVSGQLTGGVSYSDSKKFTKKAYEITNALSGNTPSWKLSYGGIREGNWHVDGLYRGINPPEQSTENVTFESEWIWEVRKSIWGNHGKTLDMRFQFASQEGFAFGNGKSNAPSYDWNDQEKYPTFNEIKTITLRAPAHFWLSQRTFVFPKTPSPNAPLFDVLAEYDWKVSTPNDWIHLSSDGGKATGGDKYQFMFEVDENNSGQMRMGHIIFEMSYNGNIESKDIQVSQASR